MRADRALIVICVALAGCMPGRTRPTELGVDALAGAMSGDDIGDPVGVGARLSLGPLALAASQGFAEEDEYGMPCGGMIDPDDSACFDQPLEQESEILRFSAGYLVVEGAGGNRLTLTPYVGGAWLTQTERGLQSDRSISAETAAWQLGARVGVERNLVADLWLGLAGDAALIMPIRLQCDDCYDPFRESMYLGALSLAVTWRLP